MTTMPRHWADVQQWCERGTGEVVTACELMRRYGLFLQLIGIRLVDLKDTIRMEDGTYWYRYSDIPETRDEHGNLS